MGLGDSSQIIDLYSTLPLPALGGLHGDNAGYNGRQIKQPLIVSFLDVDLRHLEVIVESCPFSKSIQARYFFIQQE